MPFKCEYCARLFKHKRSRDRHTKLHTGDRRYRCLHCEAAFSRSDHLKIHMKTHDNQKPFQCTICNRGYNTAAALTSHMQNHKKQLALTGSPNLTYSPRSTTSSMSSGGGGGSGGKRGAKFSPYANDPLLLMSRGSSKLSSTLAKASSGNVSSNRTPTPGSTGAGSASGGPVSGGAHGDLLSCPYCTRTDFSTLEQLGLHVQSMHGHGALGLLGADTSMPYFTPGGRRAVTPDGNSLSLGGLGPYPPITCEFCTMKFPTVPLMFAHLKTSHLDRLAGAGLQRTSPNGTSISSPLGGSRPPSGFHSLEQLHFNKSLLGNAFPSFYGGMGAGSSTNVAGMSGESIKLEHRATASSNGRDENGNESSEAGRKRKRKGHDGEKDSNHGSGRKTDKQQEDAEAGDDDDIDDGDEDHLEENDGNRSSPVDLKELNSHDPESANIKQERKDETDQAIPEVASGSTSTRSSPCDSLGSIVHPTSHPSSERNSPAEQLTPTDLSQPKMKRLKLETLLEDEDVPEPDRKLPTVGSGRSHTREPHKQRSATTRREHEPKEPPQHQHMSVPQLHSSGSNVPQSQQLNASNSTASHHVHQLPGAYLCNQCNAALPDFESFRTHLKAHLEQSAANAAAAAAMRLTGDHSATGPAGSSNASSTSGASGGSLSLTTFLCQQCGATLSCQAEYEQHTIGHFLVMAVEYRCQAAGGGGSAGTSCTGKASFGKVEDLHKHLYEGHMQLLYKCTVCGETFDSKVQVQVHFAVSHSVEVKLYRCSACAEVFRSEREFRQHIRTRHLTAGAVQCMFCRMVCSSELEMHFHLASHARKFKCPACPESFHVEFLLDRHIQTHHSQKETSSPNRRESTVPSTVPSTTSNPSLSVTTSTGTSASTTASSSVAGLDYLHLHGQMAAMAAAAAWPSLYQTANKFYNNPLQVDTLNQLKHPQHLLHGFYDTMLGKAHQQQQRSSFLPDPTTGAGSTLGSKKNPFTGHSPNTSATNALLGLGYGTSSSGSSGTSQLQRSAGTHTLNGSATGLYSPEEGTNAGSVVPAGSAKLYSPIAMIQRYGDNGGLHSTGATAGGNNSTSRPGVESPTGQLLLASHTSLGLPEHHHSEQPGRKTTQQSTSKSSSTLTTSGTAPQMATTSSAGSCYSCGICERSDFSTESEVQTHRKIVHNLKTGVSLRCAYCNGDFRSRNELENHMKVAHNTGGGKHKCLICDEIFPSPAVLAEHKLSHCKVGASGRCSHCSLPLPDAHTFKQHLQAHQQSMGTSVTGGVSSNPSVGGGTQSTGSTSSCQNGGNSTSSTGGNGGNASGSANADQDRFPQQCICCRQTLNSEFEISLHAKFHTKSPDTNERTCALCLEPLPSQPESNTKICDPCLKRHNFPSKLLSMNFLKPSAATTLGQAPTIAGPSHGIVGPSSVPIEGRITASGGIQQHEQQQTAGRDNTSSSPYQCNLCKKPLPSSHKLQEHLIDHTFAGCEERGYVCYLCSAVFTSSAGLQAHLPVAHSNAAAKPYDCERCGVAYFFRAELEHHLIDHELGRTTRSVTGAFEHSSTVRTGDDEWRSAQNSPTSEDEGSSETQKGHIKQELSEAEQEQDGSSPYHHKEDNSDEDNEESTGNEEVGEADGVNVEQQIDEEEHEEVDQVESEHMEEEDEEDDGDATNEGEMREETEPQEQEQEQDQEDEEEYIEVDEHTTMDDEGGGKAPTHTERLRRNSNMLIN
uniref:C2H2-type domain-containing protein n=1 Tax=Anopheles minimus TaxID=112268 RepID=A0A182WDR7_9DIPT